MTFSPTSKSSAPLCNHTRAKPYPLSPSLKRKHSKKYDRIPRPANAFVLFRSHYIANYTGPITQQNQLSRQAGEVWRAMNNDDHVKQHFRWEAKERRHQHALQYPGWRYNNPNPGASKSASEEDGHPTARSSEVIKVTQPSRSPPKIAIPSALTPRRDVYHDISSCLRDFSTSPTPPLASPTSSLSSFKSTEVSTPPTYERFTLDGDLTLDDKPFSSYCFDVDYHLDLQTFVEKPQTGFEVRDTATMWFDVDKPLSPLVMPRELPGSGFNYTTGNDLMMPLFGLSMAFDLTVTELDLLIGDEMGGFSHSFNYDEM